MKTSELKKVKNKLSSIKDFDDLLNSLLTQTRKVIPSDAGSIYLVEDKKLTIKCAQNDTQKKNLAEGEELPYVSFSFPITKTSIAGYCVISKKPLNIEDAYNIPPEKPYKFNIGTDVMTGYKTTSSIALPLFVAGGRVLGVLQLINALDKDGNIRTFTDDDLEIAQDLTLSISSALEMAEAAALSNAAYRGKHLQSIFEIDQKLNEIQDIDVLLERILTEARKIVNADAGSIYEVQGNNLAIKYAQNDTQSSKLLPGEKLPYMAFSFPITEKSISGYVALSGETLNIHDAYTLPDNVPYSFNPSSDKTTGYHTKSMLTIPLKIADSSLLGVLQIINRKNDEGEYIEFDEDAVLYINHFAANAANALGQAKSRRDLIETMTAMANMRDPKETGMHVNRVSKFSVEIYDRWAFNHKVDEATREKFRDSLATASKCHDFGKIGIEDKILKKPGRFDDDERALMNSHTCLGAQLFENFKSPLFEMCQDINLRHHEWWDGSRGYPGKLDWTKYEQGNPLPKAEGLKGEEIPLAARIVSVADVFDALSHARVYKPAWTMEDAVNEIQKSAGTQFDPEIVDAFMQIKDRLIAISNSYGD
ncbi:MAG: GAF domain-containing protein [Treponema sp.]|nr:GAF domain-containing protein [Treponema sp.]